MNRVVSPLLWRIVLLACAYTLVGKLGLQLDAVARFATLVWPPTGISLAALSLLGTELWPGVALGALAVNLWTGASVPVALGICLGNTLEAVVGAYALRRFAGMHGPLRRMTHVLGLVGPAALGSSLLSATIGAASLFAGGIIDNHRFGETWRTWWIGDALGDLTVGAFLLAWGGARLTYSRWPRALEAATLGALSIVVAYSVFFSAPGTASADAFLQTYLLFPLLIWAALRFGLQGATATTLLVSALAIAGTTQKHGPFVHETLGKSLLYLQIFTGFAAITGLAFGAIVTELADALRARESFLALVSHDLQNPLQTIRMTAALLGKVESDQRADVISRIERAVNRMETLIRDLLDLAAMDAGAMSLSVRPYDAAAIVEEAVEMMRPLATQREQALSVVASRHDVSIMCDRERILQLFSNLIGNAIKFTPNGGTIVAAMENGDSTMTRFRVTDSGVGIDPVEIPQLFERFRRGKRTSHRGTGLGLSISKAIVAAHGGKIWAQSRPGEGSTFFFTLRKVD